jgi:hypothetical protein
MSDCTSSVTELAELYQDLVDLTDLSIEVLLDDVRDAQCRAAGTQTRTTWCPRPA